MDDEDGSLGIRNWGFYDTVKGNLGLQLMSSVPPDRDTKSLLPNGAFLQHHGHHNAPHQLHMQHSLYSRGPAGGRASGGMPTESQPIHMDFSRNEAWLHQLHHQRPPEQKVLHSHPIGPAGHVGHPGYGGHPAHGGHIVHHHPTGYGMISDAQHTLQMMQPPLESQLQEPPPCKEEEAPPPLVEDHSVPVVSTGPPLKKRQRGRQQNRQPKSPKPKKPKKPKKAAVPLEDGAPNGHAPRRRGPKTVGMVINGIELDLANIPTPVCSCTGAPQQCYRWGAGGWQSACCTTSISTYPLPMSTKRRGARISGRKMSQGAFKKVLEKLAGEGYNLANPIDLKTFWAKHGTNKFVTIR